MFKFLVLQNTCNLYGVCLVEIDDEEENAWITQTIFKDVCMLYFFLNVVLCMHSFIELF